MKMVATAVLDKAVPVYAQPFFTRSIGEAIRSFSDACKDDKIPFRAHPEHYVLFHIGWYDDAEGVLEPLPPKMLIAATDCVGD